MPQRQFVAEEWNDFAHHILSDPEIGPEQRREMRRAFYGGASALYFCIMRGLSSGEEATEGDASFLTQIFRELQAFVEAVKEGKA